MQGQGQAAGAPDMVVAFLSKIMPFCELDEALLRQIAAAVRVDFYPKGTWLLTMGESEVQYLYLIQQGGVKSFLTDAEGLTTLKDYRGEGEYVGALGIIRGTVASMNVEAVEDTFCFLLPREVFKKLLQSQPGFAQFYLKSFSEKVVSTAYTELRKHRMTRRSDEDLFLFSTTVGDIINRRLQKAHVRTTVQNAAELMMQHSIGSLLLYDQHPEKIVGIVTDKDLRNKVVAAGKEYHMAVQQIMTAPVVTISSESVCFDALMQMMSCGIHHLAVEKNGSIEGVITSHDVMLLQGNSPYMLFKEIGKQHDLPALYSLVQKIPDVIRNLINEGAKARNIAQMISLLNDQVLSQVLCNVEAELGAPPVPYCWLLFGSEGRKEQTFKVEQNNGLLYADSEDPHQEIATYFALFAEKVVAHLSNCGYPVQRDGMMANNPRWCQPLSRWKEYFKGWLTGNDPAELVHCLKAFDVRSVYGAEALAEQLRECIVSEAKKSSAYITPLINDCITRRAPVSVFHGGIVDREGRVEATLDICEQGLGPYIKFSRLLALVYGVREASTFGRLDILHKKGYLEDELKGKIEEACEIQMHLQLIHQLHQVESGVIPDTLLSAGELTEIEKKMLKDSFEQVDALHRILVELSARMST